MSMKNKINGLYLWSVRIVSDNGRDGLWITTRKYDPASVLNKTKVFLKRNGNEYPNAVVRTMKYKGTMDA